MVALPPSFLVNQLLDLMARQRKEVVPKCASHPNQVCQHQHHHQHQHQHPFIYFSGKEDGSQSRLDQTEIEPFAQTLNSTLIHHVARMLPLQKKTDNFVSFYKIIIKVHLRFRTFAIARPKVFKDKAFYHLMIRIDLHRFISAVDHAMP